MSKEQFYQTGFYSLITLIVVQPKYRGKKISYSVWKQIQEKYKMNIILEAFFTLIPYYIKMGFKNLGVSDDEGYYDFILKYKNLFKSYYIY